MGEFWSDYGWLAWLGLAVALGAAEMATLDLLFAMVAVGALAGAATAGLGAPFVLQAVVAAVVSLAAVLLVRPVALRHLRTPAAIRTGTAALVGRHGLVLEPVDAHGGRVRLQGEVWSARSYDPYATIAPGRTVDVVQIDGATAVVIEVET